MRELQIALLALFIGTALGSTFTWLLGVCPYLKTAGVGTASWLRTGSLAYWIDTARAMKHAGQMHHWRLVIAIHGVLVATAVFTFALLATTILIQK